MEPAPKKAKDEQDESSPPVPASNQDPDNPIGILPVVAWDIVLRNLNGPDLVRVSMTGPVMQQMVRRTGRIDSINPQLFEWIVDRMDLNSILMCRRISKLWKLAVDNVMERLPFSEVDPRLASDHINAFQIDLTAVAKIFRFHQWAQTAGDRNPFVGRNVKIDNELKEQGYLQECLRLLQTHGHHIWTLDLNFCIDEEDFSSVQKRMEAFKDLLTCFPNLKRLELYAAIDLSSTAATRQMLKRIQLPPLPNIEVFVEVYKMDELLFGSILQNCFNLGNLKMLSIQAHQLTEDIVLPSLEVLKITVSSPEDIPFIKRITGPLKKFQLYYETDDEDDDVWEQFEFKDIIEVLQPYSTTVEKAFLKISINCSNMDSLPAFPKLKSLTIFHLIGNVAQFPALSSLVELVLVNTWHPMREGYSAIREAEYLMSQGQANEQHLEVLNNPANNLGVNKVLNELRVGNEDIWSRCESLNSIMCCGYSFKRPLQENL